MEEFKDDSAVHRSGCVRRGSEIHQPRNDSYILPRESNSAKQSRIFDSQGQASLPVSGPAGTEACRYDSLSGDPLLRRVRRPGLKCYGAANGVMRQQHKFEIEQRTGRNRLDTHGHSFVDFDATSVADSGYPEDIRSAARLGKLQALCLPRNEFISRKGIACSEAGLRNLWTHSVAVLYCNAIAMCADACSETDPVFLQ